MWYFVQESGVGCQLPVRWACVGVLCDPAERIHLAEERQDPAANKIVARGGVGLIKYCRVRDNIYVAKEEQKNKCSTCVLILCICSLICWLMARLTVSRYGPTEVWSPFHSVRRFEWRFTFDWEINIRRFLKSLFFVCECWCPGH